MIVAYALLMQIIGLIGRVLFYLVIHPGPLLPVAATLLLQDYLCYTGMSAAGSWVVALSAGIMVALLRWRFGETVNFIANLPAHVLNFVKEPGAYINRDVLRDKISGLVQNRALVGSIIVLAILGIAIKVSISQHIDGWRAGGTITYVGDDDNGTEQTAYAPHYTDIDITLPGYYLAGVREVERGAFRDFWQEQIDNALDYVIIDSCNMEPTISPRHVAGEPKPDALARVDGDVDTTLTIILNLPKSQGVDNINGTLCNALQLTIHGLFGDGSDAAITPLATAIINGVGGRSLTVNKMATKNNVYGYDIDVLAAFDFTAEYIDVTTPVEITIVFPPGSVGGTYSITDYNTIYIDSIQIHAGIAQKTQDSPFD